MITDTTPDHENLLDTLSEQHDAATAHLVKLEDLRAKQIAALGAISDLDGATKHAIGSTLYRADMALHTFVGELDKLIASARAEVERIEVALYEAEQQSAP